MPNTITQLLHDTPAWVYLAGVVVLAILVLARARRHSGDVRDPQRMFTADQRRAGFGRAGSQCEMSTPWLTRCTRTAGHADHFYPHARGGASSMRNLVAACAPHNLSKGAKMPSSLERRLIEHRRRRYFPQSIGREAGEWFRGAR